MATLTVSPGAYLRSLREDRGLMPEDMPMLMLKAGIDRRNIPTPRTIWRAEQKGLPILHYRFGLAQFFGVPVSHIWPPEHRRAA